MKDDLVEAKFAKFTPERPEVGCWPWRGSVGTRGYGAMYALGKARRATHVAVYLRDGAWPEAGKVVCHTCDNPACVRPDHLFVGTQSDNIRDCVAKGRFARRSPPAEVKARGERHGSAKLTEDDVRAIRASGRGVRALAAEYGVDYRAVWNARKGVTWRHVK